MRKVDYTYTYNLHTYVYSKHLKRKNGLKDAKMGGTAGFGYDIIYGSHRIGGALNCFVQVTGVQEKANCATWVYCNHSRVNPWSDSLCTCSRISVCRSRWWRSTLKLDWDLPRGVYTGEMFGLVSMWYAGPGKHPTAVRTSWFSFRRYKSAVCHAHRTISSNEWQVCCYSQQHQSYLALED